MIWIVIATLATLAFATYWGVSERNWAAFFVSGAAAVIVSALFTPLFVIFGGAIAYGTEHYTYSFDVLAAKDGSSIEGSFGIFGGTIGEEQYYFFYRQYADGHIEQGKILADRTVIFQDQETLAFIEVTKARSDLRFWGIPSGDTTRYEIHVPPGSVVPAVEFDLE